MAGRREFDVIVFGATGFAGKYAAKYLHDLRLCLRWAVAGRSRGKLEQLVAGLKAANAGGCEPAVLVADALGSADALRALFARARVVISFAGPYSRLGGPIVAAAVAAGAHYVDVSAEPGFISATEVEFDDGARAAGTLVVSACGCGHVPSDIGCAFVGAQLRARAGAKGVANPKMAVEMFAQLTAPAGFVLHTATLDTILGAQRSVWQLARTEKLLRARHGGLHVAPYRPRFGFRVRREPRLGPDAPIVCANDGDTLAVRRTLYGADVGRGAGGMAGSGDLAFRAYAELGSWVHLCMVICSILACALVNMLPGGQGFILRFARFFTWGMFSGDGPTEEQVEKTHGTMTFIGRARDDNGKDVAHVVVKSAFPEPAYVATSKMAIAASLTILEHREKLPEGGVFTPGLAFYGAGKEMRETLTKLGAMDFRVVSS